MQFTEVDC
jgi:hypothetical protein